MLVRHPVADFAAASAYQQHWKKENNQCPKVIKIMRLCGLHVLLMGV